MKAAPTGGAPAAAEREHRAPDFWNAVRLLGRLLGRVIERDRGAEFLERIETIRALAKGARNRGEWAALYQYLEEIPSYEVTDVTRAFNQFLNLANVAEQFYQVRNLAEDAQTAWANLFERLAPEQAAAALATMRLELVLTPHPTEVMRRTLILKYDAIAAELQRPEPSERRLERLVAETWHTEEMRRERPSPQDEAKWGFAVVENSLWEALPACLRDIDHALAKRNLPPLPAHAAPVAIASWMGGDRDGNPNVTAAVTRETLMLARWMAADLYLRDVQALQADLSMKECNGALRKRVGTGPEPYRTLLREVRERLMATRDWAEALHPAPVEGIYHTTEELLEPLELCDRSLRDVGLELIANGPLRDTLRRVHAFGVTLVSLDIRQRTERHTAALDEITEHLGITAPGGSYANWSEAQRVEFLLRELDNRRPLFPEGWAASPASQEVLDTCRVIAEVNGAGISTYIVSNAREPSDVLAAALLLRKNGVTRNLPVTPRFETRADLEGAAKTMAALLAHPWYASYAQGAQQVMIGYSTSAKDAGQLAAAWVQYQAKEQLTEVARSHGVQLTLFHGRGGAVGSGRGAARAAILSQPPCSVAGRLRFTEQGETIRFKLGNAALARDTLMRYLIGVVEATLAPPAPPTAAQRQAMAQLAERSAAGYRRLVAEETTFLDYFREVTPEEELGALTFHSEFPRAPRQAADIAAIPWVFAWNQVRLMLPAWLGADAALASLRDDEGTALFDALMRWPFFAVQMNALESALAKTDLALADFYANRLAPRVHQGIHDIVRRRLATLTQDLLALRRQRELLAENPIARDSLSIRNTYLDPLHLLQAELLGRIRETEDEHVTEALKETMAGIASGLRHTG